MIDAVPRGGGGVAGLHQLLDGSAVGSAFRGTGRLVVPGADDEVLAMRAPSQDR